MKTNLLTFCFLLASFGLSAQTVDPASWDTIIHTTPFNGIIRDTFLIQSFENDIHDNWEWENTGTKPARIQHVSNLNIQGGDKDYFLQLPVNGSVKLSVPDTEQYQTWYISFWVAAREVNSGASLLVFSNTKEENGFSQALTIKSTNYPKNFREEFSFNNRTRDHIFVYTNPQDLTLSASGSSGNFYIDNLLMHGDCKKYALFTGKGNWKDYARWEFFSPSGKQTKLINGDVLVTDVFESSGLHLSNGSITIRDGGSLKQEKTYLYGNNIGIYTGGNYETSQQVTLVKEFPERGKWYFVSFPFDVYRSGVDDEFILKDESPNDGGDFYYVLSYDGKGRNESGQAYGNWRVIPKSYPLDVPLFERGKGYLIALDEKAGKQQLLFSSQKGEVVLWNNKEFILSLDIPFPPNSNSEHHGWVLCGNPFPAPLSVKQIVQNSNLEPDLYYFNGSQYVTISVDSDTLIPPFTAYFVKASSSTNLRIIPPATFSGGPQLPAGISLFNKAEPLFVKSSVPASGSKQESLYHLQGRNLVIDNPGQPGEVIICNISGSTVFKREIPTGNSHFSLPIPKGIYVLSIRTGKERAYDKFILYE